MAIYSGVRSASPTRQYYQPAPATDYRYGSPLRDRPTIDPLQVLLPQQQLAQQQTRHQATIAEFERRQTSIDQRMMYQQTSIQHDHHQLLFSNGHLQQALHHKEEELSHLRQLPQTVSQLEQQLQRTAATRLALEQHLAVQEAQRDGLEQVTFQQRDAIAELAHNLEHTNQHLAGARAAYQHEQHAADTLANGFIEMDSRASAEHDARQQAEQVLEQSVKGTIQWLDQVKNNLSMLQDQLAAAPAALTSKASLDSAVGAAIPAAQAEVGRRLESRAGLLSLDTCAPRIQSHQMPQYRSTSPVQQYRSMSPVQQYRSNSPVQQYRSASPAYRRQQPPPRPPSPSRTAHSRVRGEILGRHTPPKQTVAAQQRSTSPPVRTAARPSEREELEECVWAPGSPTGHQGSDLFNAKKSKQRAEVVRADTDAKISEFMSEVLLTPPSSLSSNESLAPVSPNSVAMHTSLRVPVYAH